jgi:hypothetical protein
MLVFIGLSISLFSCDNKCYKTSDKAFNAVKKAISLKDIQTLKSLTSEFELKFIDYESLLSEYQVPSIDLIPEDEDGGYGVKNIDNTVLYFTNFNENGIRKEIKVIVFQNKNGCFKIVNIADVEKSFGEKMLPAEIYEIINKETNQRVQNFNVLYKDSNKSLEAIESFVYRFRDKHAIKASNITIVDDIRAIELIDAKRNLTDEENQFLSKHWIAYSPFDAPELVLMYPNQ